MKFKTMCMMFGLIVFGLVMSIIPGNMVLNDSWMTYEFFNETKAYGMPVLFMALAIAFIVIVNIIFFIGYLIEDNYDTDALNVFFWTYATIISVCMSILATMLFISAIGVLMGIISIVVLAFLFICLIKYKNEIAHWFKDKFTSDKEVEEFDKEHLEYQEKRKEKEVRDYVNKCRNML